MNELIIRRAGIQIEDARILRDVEHRSLGDSDYAAEEIVAVLQRPEQVTYLAYWERHPVGFCSCFETPYEVGTRLEIDMLGVMPDYRNRGIARRLIAHSISEGRIRGIQRYRAVVKDDNGASQAAFAHAGFVRSPLPQHLMVYSIQGYHPLAYLPLGWDWRYHVDGTSRVLDPSDEAYRALAPCGCVCTLRDAVQQLVGVAQMLMVATLAYDGLWVEKMWVTPGAARTMARALVEQAKHLGLDEVGYLLPTTTSDTQCNAWLAEGYQMAGSYYLFEQR